MAFSRMGGIVAANLDKSQRPTTKWCIVNQNGYILWSYERDGKHFFASKEEAEACHKAQNMASNYRIVQVPKVVCQAFRQAKSVRSTRYIYLDGHTENE